MKELEQGTIESSELVEETLRFWFTDNDHIRSPFPEYIRPELKKRATEGFYQWVANLDPQAKEEVDDEIVAEKFEEIIFENAMTLIQTEDEKITIQYPFLPRINDEISTSDDENEEKSIVKDRHMFKSEDHSYLKVKLEKVNSKEMWETKFELPL
jgi:hypothetical protein